MKLKELLLSVKKLLVSLLKFLFSWEALFVLQFLAILFIAFVMFKCHTCWDPSEKPSVFELDPVDAEIELIAETE